MPKFQKPNHYILNNYSYFDMETTVWAFDSMFWLFGRAVSIGGE